MKCPDCDVDIGMSWEDICDVIAEHASNLRVDYYGEELPNGKKLQSEMYQNIIDFCQNQKLSVDAEIEEEKASKERWKAYRDLTEKT